MPQRDLHHSTMVTTATLTTQTTSTPDRCSTIRSGAGHSTPTAVQHATPRTAVSAVLEQRCDHWPTTAPTMDPVLATPTETIARAPRPQAPDRVRPPRSGPAQHPSRELATRHCTYRRNPKHRPDRHDQNPRHPVERSSPHTRPPAPRWRPSEEAPLVPLRRPHQSGQPATRSARRSDRSRTTKPTWPSAPRSDQHSSPGAEPQPTSHVPAREPTSVPTRPQLRQSQYHRSQCPNPCPKHALSHRQNVDTAGLLHRSTLGLQPIPPSHARHDLAGPREVVTTGTLRKDATRPATDTATADTTKAGYDALWRSVRAADVGAAHRRERVFLLAWPRRRTADAGRGDAADADHARRFFQRHLGGQPTGRPVVVGRATAAAHANRLGREELHPQDAARWAIAARRGPAAADAEGIGHRHGGTSSRTGVPAPAVPASDPACRSRGVPADTTGDRRDQGLPSATRLQGRPDAALGGHAAADHADRKRHLVAVAAPVQQPVASASARSSVDWGDYSPAVRRWEQVLGRGAPFPTQLGKHGRPVLAPPLRRMAPRARTRLGDRTPAPTHRAVAGAGQRRRATAGRPCRPAVADGPSSVPLLRHRGP
jgi:site-specific DNA-cytosine methylase